MTQSDTPLAAVPTTGQQRIAAFEAEIGRLQLERELYLNGWQACPHCHRSFQLVRPTEVPT